MYLDLTDGTTTCVIQDDAVAGVQNYALSPGGWTPSISKLRASELSDRQLHEPVMETLRLNVRGTSAANCYANFRALLGLLYQAERWWRGEKVTRVLFRFSPHGASTSSKANPLQAVVLRPAGDLLGLEYTPQLDPINWGYEIRDVTVALWRDDWKLNVPTTGSGTTERVSSSATASRHAAVNMAFTGTAPAAHYALSYALIKGATNVAVNGWLIITRNNASKNNLYQRDAGNFTLPSGDFSAFNDTANYPRQGTNVVRVTPASTSTLTSPSFGTVQNFYRAACIVNYRNNSGSTTFRMRIRLVHPTTSDEIFTQWKGIDSASTEPRFVRFEPLPLEYNVGYTAYLQIVASAASGTLDINDITFIEDAEPLTQVIGFEYTYERLVIRHAYLNDDRYSVAYRNQGANELTATPETVSALGALTIYGPADLWGYGNDLTVLPLICTAARWAQATSAPALDTVQHVLTRRPVYLAPE